ncbi:MAG TPA: hypothetical protein VF050_09810, partial [Moraxellaceae bacterium]
MIRPLFLLVAAGILSGCASAVLSSLPANAPEAYNAQAKPAVDMARTQFTIKGDNYNTKPAQVLIAPVYLSARYLDSVDFKNQAISEYVGWWGAKPDNGGWAMQFISNISYRILAKNLKENYELVDSEAININGSNPPKHDFAADVATGPGEGPYPYVSKKQAYYHPNQAAALANAMKVDTVIFPRVQVYFDKRAAGLSKMNEEIVIDYDMLVAADTVVCNRGGQCKTVSLPAKSPMKIRVP